jgi:hypothetical protein
MALALLAAGCIVADPPTSSDPEKTPPVLFLGEANPAVYQVRPLWKTSGSSRVQIDVPVRSEDSGDPLHFDFYLNWNVAGQKILAGRNIEPSTFADTSRSIGMEWDYSTESVGCKQVTLVVTHASNFIVTYPAPSYTNPADIAIATWFFNLGDDPPGTNALNDCPSSIR